MNVVISFSGRRDGNCDQIARYLSSDCDNIIYFRDLRVHECVNCEY